MIRALVITLVLSVLPAAASADKIAFVDYERVLRESAAGKRASGKFERSLKKRQSELDKQQKKLQEDAKQLERQASALKPEVVQKRQRELEGRFVEIQKTYQKLEKELAAERASLFQKVIKQSQPVVKELAKKGGFDLVLDRSAVIWAVEGRDLTGDVVKRLK